MGHVSLEKQGLHSKVSRNSTCHDSITNKPTIDISLYKTYKP